MKLAEKLKMQIDDAKKKEEDEIQAKKAIADTELEIYAESVLQKNIDDVLKCIHEAAENKKTNLLVSSNHHFHIKNVHKVLTYLKDEGFEVRSDYNCNDVNSETHNVYRDFAPYYILQISW